MAIAFVRADSDKLSAATDFGIGAGAITLECWVKIDTAPASGERFMFMFVTDEATDVQYLLEYENAAGTLRLHLGRNEANGDFVRVTVDLDLGTTDWHHVAGTYDTSNINLYHDGVLVAGPTATTGNGSGTTGDEGGIGAETLNNDHHCTATIDEARIWNDARSATELLDLRNRRMVGNELNMRAYYRLDEGDTSTMNDMSQGGTNFTFENTPQHADGAPIFYPA